MESTNSTTRTYTAPTCTLLVTTKAPPLPNLTQLRKTPAIDFTLHLDHPEQGESERVTLKGNPQQLDKLQQSVSQYVAELVAKFPLPVTDTHNSTPAPQPPAIDRADIAASNRVDLNPGTQSTRSGLMQNLPGLRTGAAQPTPAKTADDVPSTSPLSTKNISKLLGRSYSDSIGTSQSDEKHADVSTTTPTIAPYLTAGDRSLDHKLHLGNLATSSSGEVLTLSAIQLFDLSTTLDEYAAVANPKPAAASTPTAQTPAAEPAAKINTTTYRKGIGAATSTSPPAPETFAPVPTPNSRIPNLPNLPTPLNQSNSQVYDYANGDSRPAFLSVIPWAAAAALAVGVPLLLFGSKSNSLKELTASVKLPAFKAPDLDAAKKSVMSRLPGQETDTSSPETTTGATGANLPKPWEQQSIQPPQTQTSSTSPAVPGAQMPTNPDKIGIAPLPPTVVSTAQQASQPQAAIVSEPAKAGTNGKQLPAAIASMPAQDSMSGIAPNPLNTTSVPTIDPTQPTRPNRNNPVTTLPVSPAKIATAPKVGKPTVNPKVSMGKKSTVIPPNISVSRANIGSVPAPVPFSPAEIAVVERINPTPFKPTVQKKATQPKIKPTAIATKPKAATVKPPSPFITPQPSSVEQIIPAPNSNPNIIGPLPSTSSEGTEVQNQPIIPEPQIQSNVGRNPANPDPFDTPSLQEAKRYFQGKWQADPNQSNPLQYVVQVSGKSGIVRSINPQGEAATEYLKKTGVIKPGQKLVSPAAAGNSDQKIRVLLQPDGNVDAFVEP